MRVLLVLLLCLPAWVHADIYQWQDVDGKKHFSDRPLADAKRLDIKPGKVGYAFFRVKTVYDGDTVVLEDGRKIRFLGINTPEVQHRDKPADAGGEEAKRWLIDALKNSKVRLEISAEKTDKYGRTLAHLFTEKKQHLNLQLVEAGLAAVSIYPPNLSYVNELVSAENRAEQAKLGIWGRPEYAVMPVSSLTDAGHSGWTRLTGKVANIRRTRKSTYLEFATVQGRAFEARIENKWLDLFPDVDGYLGKTIEVRGWLSRGKGKFSMLIRHPSAIRLAEK
ncbi:MAG: thermonuclease family protein [Methylobacter sp.]|nr:thermonuclease family protein [Methylobacter sp.]MDP2098522.1 thermonuclease family protein [Methylobacter sp.]MDP2428247.1 thermonuclease family protein [Methylobacter sp.]MDP3053760.1 thermonuclease family protein [Methylobacter sp.]MDP3363981.1 thermonuclease family protein [Methylobacter sp.]